MTVDSNNCMKKDYGKLESTEQSLVEIMDFYLTVGNCERDGNTSLLRNLYGGQEATVRTGHGTTNWLQIRKSYISQNITSCFCFYFPCYESSVMS